MLDAADEVAFLVGRPGRRRRHPRLRCSRRDPDYRAVVTRSGGRRRPGRAPTVAAGTPMSTDSCPSPTAGRVRRYAVRIARRHPRLLWSALALHVLAAARRAGRAAPARRPGRGRRGGHDRRPRRPRRAGAGGLRASPRGADPLRALRLPGARRAGAGRAARGLRRQRPGAAGGRRRVRRVGRPAHPHLPRRRPARLVGPLGAARVDDRAWSPPCSPSRPPCRSAGGSPCPACWGCRRWWSGLRWYLARAKDGYLREWATYSRINATLTETVEGARTVEALGPGRGAGTPPRRRLPRVLLGRALHALPAHRVLPEHGAVLPDPDRAHPALGWLAVLPRLGLAGRGDGGDPLRADADRPGRPHRLDPRRAADGRGLAGPAARRRPGARRPRGQRPRAGGREARRARRPVRLRHGRDVLHGVSLDVGVGERLAMVGPVGCRQVDARSAARRDPPTPHR